MKDKEKLPHNYGKYRQVILLLMNFGIFYMFSGREIDQIICIKEVKI